METARLLVAPEVARVIGSEQAMINAARAASVGYRCPVCGGLGALVDGRPASLIIVLSYRAATTPVVRVAHESCCDSGIYLLNDPVNAEAHDFWPGMAWLRHDRAQPRAVLVISPVTAPVRVTASGETVNELTCALLERGFALLLTPDGPMPCHHGLRVRLGRGRVRLSGVYGEALWDDAVSLPDAWERAARDAGQVGVAVAAGLRLCDESRDHVADLSTVIGDGTVAAATAQLVT